MGDPYAGLVLLVDDDSELRRAMREFLQQSGCAVLEARNAYDGLFLCAQYGNEISVMITELNLLPVGGVKLAENALRLWPRIQVVCTSVDADPAGVGYWMRYLNAQFLPKPFSPFQLHEKVFSLLGNRLEDATMSILDCQPLSWMANAPEPEAVPVQTQGMRTQSVQAHWEGFRPHADISRPSTNTDDPLFWLKEF
ncbi:MAG: hypothetical protein JWP91_2266 [Fibrobacteres bacterium]|nr:hypothetical protein [Fibrobacterota bacterium]